MNDFLIQRKKGIGGSDIAAIIGVSQFKTALEVYLSKTTEQPEQQGEHLYWGHALENPIIDRFIQDTGANVIRQPEMRQHEWAIANADALIVDGAGNPQAILEIKTASAYKTKDWGSDGDNVPIEYIAQVQWYMEIFNVDYAHIAVLIGGRDYRQYTIARPRTGSRFTGTRQRILAKPRFKTHPTRSTKRRRRAKTLSARRRRQPASRQRNTHRIQRITQPERARKSPERANQPTRGTAQNQNRATRHHATQRRKTVHMENPKQQPI